MGQAAILDMLPRLDTSSRSIDAISVLASGDVDYVGTYLAYSLKYMLRPCMNFSLTTSREE